MKILTIDKLKTTIFIGILACAQSAQVYAAHGDVSLTGSNFEIDTDANLTVEHGAASEDWSDTVRVQKRKADEPSGSSDDSFGQGSKEDTSVPAVTSGSIPPNKSDLDTFGVYLENAGLNDRFLHLFWTRVQDPSGTTNMDFEFNQSGILTANGVTPERTYLDMLIQYDLSKGGANPLLFLSFWLDGAHGSINADCEAGKLPCWGKKSNLTGANLATGSINTSFIPAAASDGLGDLDPRTFGEASIDFAGIAAAAGGASCLSFGSVYLKSRSADSFTSALKDFIAPIETNVSNCASLVIFKRDDAVPSNALTGGEFQVWADNDSNHVSFDSTEDGKDDGVSGMTYNHSCTTGGAGGSCTISNVLAGDYWVVEVTPPIGHELPDPAYQLVTIQPGGDDVEVTFTDPRIPAKLTITKRDDEATLVDGAIFDLWVDTDESSTFNTGDAATAYSCTSGDTTTGVCEITGILPPGLYCVVETAPAGYASADPQCLEIKLADSLSLAFVNDRLPAKLTITKQDDLSALVDGAVFDLWVDTDESSTFNTGDAATAYSCTSGDTTTGVCEITGILPPGLYCVVETEPAGYASADPQCLEIKLDDSLSMTFTNDRKPAKLTITKRDDEATLVDGAIFNLWVDTDKSGTFNTGDAATAYSCTSGATAAGVCEITGILPPGDYCVVETEPAGYASADPQCLEIKLDDSLSMTFTNDRKPAKLTITKRDDEATLVDGAIFNLWVDTDKSGTFNTGDAATAYSCTSGATATGVCEITGILPPGFYCVVETEPDGYASAPAQCLEIKLDDSLSLSFTNPRLRGAIKITKTRKHAAASSPSDDPHSGVTFTITGGELDAPGTEVTTDSNGIACLDGLVLSALPGIGDYTVTETVPLNYVADGDDTKTVTVTAQASCGSGNEANVAFSNTPLSKITVKVDSLVLGGTKSEITCKLGETTVGQVSFTENPTLELNNKEPGIYVCTINVDP